MLHCRKRQGKGWLKGSRLLKMSYFSLVKGSLVYKDSIKSGAKETHRLDATRKFSKFSG